MRILKKHIDYQSKKGFVFLIPDSEDDLWYIYNLIIPGDLIKASTFRKVQKTTQTGSVVSDKKHIKVTLAIESINYLTENDSIELFIKGKNATLNEYINLGQYHTIKIQLSQAISIMKNSWEKYHLDLLQESADITQTCDVAALVMDEGIAHLCYVKNNTTRIKSKIEKNIPKKKQGNSDFHGKQLGSFYGQCYQTILNVDFENIKCFLIASPGYVKDQFFEFMKQQVQKEQATDQIKKFKREMDKMILVHSANGYINCLTEVFLDETVQKQLKNTRIVGEVLLIEKFYQTMSKDSDKTAYGAKYCLEANANQAIESLLISDKLFRSRNFSQRKIYNELCEQVKQVGGEVIIFSTMHISGEKLNSLGGIAAILRFPLNMDYLDDTEDINDIDDDENIEEIQVKQFQNDPDFDVFLQD